jgi:ubiquinone/menaquinone biosynthesis C-methylase UbiE
MSDADRQSGQMPLHSMWQQVDNSSDPQWFIRFLDASRRPARAAIEGDLRGFYSYLDPQEGDHILDVGSGTGDLVRPLARLVGPSGRVVGVDYSQVMVDEARKRAQEEDSPVEFQQGDIQHLNFADRSFDRTQVRLVFQHLAEPRPSLGEIIRVTKPGGKIAIVEQDWETLMIDAGNREVTRKIANLFCDLLPNGWIGRQLMGLLKEAGLQDVTATAATTMLPPDYEMVSQLLGLEPLLERAQEQALITPDEAAEWQQDLQERAGAGRFFSAFVLFTVTGRKAE